MKTFSRWLLMAAAAAAMGGGCGGDKNGTEGEAAGASGPDPASSRITLDKAALLKDEPAVACAKLYDKLHSCREAFNRRVTAVTALDLGPDDAHAQAWVIEPMTAKASGGLCLDDKFVDVVRTQIENCYSNDCDQLSACMMPGTALELDCPAGTRTMIRMREERIIAWCVRGDGTPHGPMVAGRDSEVRVRGEFADGKRVGTWRWPDRDATVSYSDGRPTAHNGTPVAALPEAVESSYRLLAMNVVGPEVVLSKGPIKAQPMAVLQEEELFAPCVSELSKRLNYAEGQLRVSFDVTAERKATNVEIIGFDAALATCWEQKILSVSFDGDFGDAVSDGDSLKVRAAWGIRSKP